jgi:hypothetical protein
MKVLSITNFLKVVLVTTTLILGSSSIAQTLMSAAAKDGTLLLLNMPQDAGDNTQLSIKSPAKKVKKYLIYLSIVNGQVKFAEAVICQRNCANAKSATPGLPLRGIYHRVESQLRCSKNCYGIEDGLIFAVNR